MTLIWLGGALIALGGLLALVGRLAAWRRRRRGANGAGSATHEPRRPLRPLALLLRARRGARLAARDPGGHDGPLEARGQPVPPSPSPAIPKTGLASAEPRDGQPRLVNIFASWCVPCIAEAADLAQLKARGVHRRDRGPRPARGRRRLPRPQWRSLRADRQRPWRAGPDRARLLGRTRKLRRRWARHHPLPAHRPDRGRDMPDDALPSWRRRMRLSGLACWHLWSRSRRWPTATCRRPIGPTGSFRCAAGSARPGADGGACAASLPGPIDRRHRCRTGRRHARPRPPPDRRRREAGEIRAWLIERYGSWISYRPPHEPARGRCWLAPLAVAGRRRVDRGGADQPAGAADGLADPAAADRASHRRTVDRWAARVDADGQRRRRCCSAAPAMRCRAGPGLRRRALPQVRRATAMSSAAKARHALLRHFTGLERWLIMAEQLSARARPKIAVGLVQNAARRTRTIPIVDRSRQCPGRPFARPDAAGRARLSARGEAGPIHPAPPFFYGLALARSGRPTAASAIWKGLAREPPRPSRWRPLGRRRRRHDRALRPPSGQ